MRLLVAAFFLVAFLDALSTYVAVSLGVGVEANPALADIVNSNPAAIFPLSLASAALASVVAVVVNKLSMRLPAPIRVNVMRFVTVAYAVAILVRVAVAVNNLILML